VRGSVLKINKHKYLVTGIRPMPSVKCPECGARVKLREDEKRIRCPECGERFALEADEDEAGEDRSRSRARRTPVAAQSSGTKVAVVVGACLLFLGIIAAALVLLTRGGGGGVAGGGAGDEPDGSFDPGRVTRVNFWHVKPGMTREEVEAILGPSIPATDRLSIRSAATFAELKEDEIHEPAQLGADVTWRRWDASNLLLWVAFGPTREGPRAMYAKAIDMAPAGGGIEFRFEVGRGEPMERALADRKQDAAIRADPKWVRGPKSRELVAGMWLGDGGRYLFGTASQIYAEDGSMSGAKQDLMHRVVDDRYVDVARLYGPKRHTKFDWNLAETQRYEYFVTRDEMALVSVRTQVSYNALTYYRLPLRAGSAGEKDLLIPALADLKSTDQNKRWRASATLAVLGKDAAIALPALLELQKHPNRDVAALAQQLIEGMK
jgi:hypothetical protein